MSAIHTNKTSNGSVQAIFHIPTIAGSNTVGITWVECVRNCKDFLKSTTALQKDDLPAINAGEIIVHEELFTFSAPDITDGQKLAELQARYEELELSITLELQKKCKYFGGEGDPE